MEYRIGLIGCGTVGQGLLEILSRKKEYLKQNFDFVPTVVAICDKLKGTLVIPEGINPRTVLKLIESGRNLAEYPDADPEQAEPLDPPEMIERANADIIVELTYTDIQTAEPATSYIRKAFQTGKHVVTSNKGPAALYYSELTELARSRGLQFRIEGTVMSGTPVFSLIEQGLAGNEIREIQGILNGTTNFILTRMETEGMDYAAALKLAQQLGYAEADPEADVEGYDAAAKITILSNVLLGGSINPSDVETMGITAISRGEIEAARAEGHRYKLIAQAKRQGGTVSASVQPCRIPLSDPLAGVMGVQNAVSLDADLVGRVTIQGAGAGRTETGFSILSDLLAIHRRHAQKGLRG